MQQQIATINEMADDISAKLADMTNVATDYRVHGRLSAALACTKALKLTMLTIDIPEQMDGA